MKLSISTGLYYKLDYITIFDLISKAGFTSIELFLNQAFENVPIADIQSQLEKHRLHVSSIHTPLEFIAFPKKESEEYWIQQSMKMAKVLGALLINTHMVIGENFENKDLSLDEVHKHNLSCYGNNGEIILTTENLPAYSGNDLLGNMENFIAFVNDNNIPVTFDVTHCATGGLPLISTFDRVKNQVKNIHLSNYDHGVEHKLLTDGELDITAFMLYLKEIDYQGLVTLEFDFDNPVRNMITSLEDAENKLKETYKFISGLM